MIDIQPYIDKLERLREYMDMKINWYEFDSEHKKLLSIYNETGMLFTRIHHENFYIPSFEEWLKPLPTNHYN